MRPLRECHFASRQRVCRGLSFAKRDQCGQHGGESHTCVAAMHRFVASGNGRMSRRQCLDLWRPRTRRLVWFRHAVVEAIAGESDLGLRVVERLVDAASQSARSLLANLENEKEGKVLPAPELPYSHTTRPPVRGGGEAAIPPFSQNGNVARRFRRMRLLGAEPLRPLSMRGA